MTGADKLSFQDLSAYLQRYFTDILGSHDEQDSGVITRYKQNREIEQMFSGQCLWLVQNVDEKCDDNVFTVIKNYAYISMNTFYRQLFISLLFATRTKTPTFIDFK